jgi:two-component system sensor histidine kinase CpxA
MADRIQTLLTAERRLLLDVSHELRSPLARLKFAVQLARTNPDRQHALDRIERDIDRLTVLVSELLQVTRAESDPQARASQPVNLEALLNEVAEAGRIEAQARRCQLKLVGEAQPWLLGDHELLHRAIENVVRNAIRFAPEGSEVVLKLTRQENEIGSSAIVTVRDYGPGVPEQAIHGLFQPFFRVEADRNRMQGGGFGLGLSIAQRAVSLHEGTIRARNAHPGLLVEITLPHVIERPDEIPSKQLLARAHAAHS